MGPQERCRRRWAAPDQTLLVHCGRLSVEKHAHRTIDAVAATAVASVISRPERLRRSSARQRAEQFTWPRAAAGMLNVFGRLRAARVVVEVIIDKIGQT